MKKIVEQKKAAEEAKAAKAAAETKAKIAEQAKAKVQRSTDRGVSDGGRLFECIACIPFCVDIGINDCCLVVVARSHCLALIFSLLSIPFLNVVHCA